MEVHSEWTRRKMVSFDRAVCYMYGTVSISRKARKFNLLTLTPQKDVDKTKKNELFVTALLQPTNNEVQTLLATSQEHSKTQRPSRRAVFPSSMRTTSDCSMSTPAKAFATFVCDSDRSKCPRWAIVNVLSKKASNMWISQKKCDTCSNDYAEKDSVWSLCHCWYVFSQIWFQ